MRVLVLLAGLLVLAHGMSVDNLDALEKALKDNDADAGGQQPTLEELEEKQMKNEDTDAEEQQPTLKDLGNEEDIEMKSLDLANDQEDGDVAVTEKDLTGQDKRYMRGYGLCAYYSYGRTYYYSTGRRPEELMPWLNKSPYSSVYGTFGRKRVRVYLFRRAIRIGYYYYNIYLIYYRHSSVGNVCKCPSWRSLRLNVRRYRG